MPDFLDEKVREIRDRLKELKPLVEEYQRLEAAATALDSAAGAGSETPTRARRTRSGAASTTTRTRRGRPRAGQATRRDEVLAAVAKTPGLTISELARELGMSTPNYLYRVVPELEQEGLVLKQGNKVLPVHSPSSPGTAAPAPEPEPEATSEPTAAPAKAETPAKPKRSRAKKSTAKPAAAKTDDTAGDKGQDSEQPSADGEEAEKSAGEPTPAAA